ncbi:MAG: hypothetical protein IIB00_07135, partial [candidate division Zixibacteria bacterium]|nr:hypothetical protein [candidate division Zixibacteria bacterium]
MSMILSGLKYIRGRFYGRKSQGERGLAVLRTVIRAVLIALILGLGLFISSVIGEGIQSKDFEPSAIHTRSMEYFISGAAISISTETQSVGAGNQFGVLSSASQSQFSADVKISETISPAKFAQSNPALDKISDGSIIVVWQDEREGAFKIFMQKLDANGVVVGANVLAAERTDGFNLIEPKIKATISNKFYLAYRDEAAGSIRCIRFNSDLSVDLSDFRLDESSGAYAGPFSIDSRATGELLVAYENYNGGNNILIRRFGPTGSTISSTITANSDGGMSSHWNPSIAYGSDGEFAVAWEDYRSGNADIYFRIFDSSGLPVGAELNMVDDISADSAARDSFQVAPALVFSAISQYVVAWSDNRSGWNVYFQRYHKQIGLLNQNQIISISDTLNSNLNVTLSIDNIDRVNAIYSSHATRDRTLLQRYDETLTALGEATELNSSGESVIRSPSLVSTNAGGFAGVWTSSQLGNSEIHLMLADSSGTRALETEKTLNDDISGAISDQPALASAPGLVLVTAFRDERNDAGDIYAQITSLAEINSGPNKRVNTDPFGSLQFDPDVAANQSQILIVWVDERPVNGVFGSRVFARRGSILGVFTENEFQISGESTAPKAGPAVAISPDGSAMIAWIDLRFGTPQIIGRLIDQNGILNPVELTISSPGADKVNSEVRVEVDQSNRFRVFWIDRAALGGPKIRSRAYTSAGAFVGDVDFTSDQGLLEIEEYDVALDTAGNIFYLWSSSGEPGSLFLSGRSFAGAVS